MLKVNNGTNTCDTDLSINKSTQELTENTQNN